MHELPSHDTFLWTRMMPQPEQLQRGTLLSEEDGVRAPPAPHAGCLFPCSGPCISHRKFILPDTASPGVWLVNISRETPKRQIRVKNSCLGCSVHPEPETILINSLPSSTSVLDPSLQLALRPM